MAEPGHPTDYKPEFCERVIKLMRKGASKEEIAYRLNVCPRTIYNWEEKHPEFLQAITLGAAHSKGWWMIKGRKNIYNKDFNTALYQINMRNRFGWDKNEHKVDVTVSETKTKMTDADEQYKKSF